MNNRFNCVEMKHKAARIINRRTSKMTKEEEMEYWLNITKKYKHSAVKRKATKI